MDYCLCLLFFIVCFKRVKIDKKSIRCQKKQKKRCFFEAPLFLLAGGRLFLSALLAYHVGCAKAEQHGYAAAQRGGFVAFRTVAGKARSQ